MTNFMDFGPLHVTILMCPDSLQNSRTLVVFFATVVCHCGKLKSCCFSSEVSERVEFVGDVQENDEFETPILDRAAYVFCVPKCKSVMMDSTEVPSSSKRVSDGSEQPAATHEKFDQSTGEVFCAVGCRDDLPIVDSGSVVSTCPVDYATSVPTEKVHYRMNLESVLGESLQHYGIKR